MTDLYTPELGIFVFEFSSICETVAQAVYKSWTEGMSVCV